MIINVTEEHIKKGVPCNTNHCPVALAVFEQLGLKRCTPRDADFDRVVVNPTHIHVDQNETMRTARTPFEVRLFIDDFDLGRDVKAFTFELDL